MCTAYDDMRNACASRSCFLRRQAKVTARPGFPAENTLICQSPSGRHTFGDSEGSFSIQNSCQGPLTLHSRLRTPRGVPIIVGYGKGLPVAELEFGAREPAKPMRTIFARQSRPDFRQPHTDGRAWWRDLSSPPRSTWRGRRRGELFCHPGRCTAWSRDDAGLPRPGGSGAS